jgi:hypothetical protein
MTPSTIKHKGQWRGVIRVNGQLVWSCGHAHRNRDHSSHVNGMSALDCARLELEGSDTGIAVLYKEPYSRTLPKQLSLFEFPA